MPDATIRIAMDQSIMGGMALAIINAHVVPDKFNRQGNVGIMWGKPVLLIWQFSGTFDEARNRDKRSVSAIRSGQRVGRNSAAAAPGILISRDARTFLYSVFRLM